MKDLTPIAVTSRSFSKHPTLRQEVLEEYSNVKFNDTGATLSGPGLVDFLNGSTKAITATERIDESILSALPDLKVISKVGVGLDMLDIAALERHGVLLAWQGGTNSRSVAELTLGLILTSLRDIATLSTQLRGGAWSQPKGRELSRRTVGIAGLGHVGRDLALLLEPFECNLVAYDLAPNSGFCMQHSIGLVSLEELLQRSDIVSLHLPLTPDTRGIINSKRLAMMKAGSLLVNTARGGLVESAAVKDSLKAGRISAAFDVFDQEPPVDLELLNLPNVVATPHIGGSTEESIIAMGRAAIRGLKSARPAHEVLV